MAQARLAQEADSSVSRDLLCLESRPRDTPTEYFARLHNLFECHKILNGPQEAGFCDA